MKSARIDGVFKVGTTPEEAFQRYSDEVQTFHRMMENPATPQNIKFEQAMLLQKVWKAFTTVADIGEAAPGQQDRLREMVERNDNLAYALNDVRACLVAIDYGQLLDHVTISDKHIGLQFDASCRLIIMALKLANDAIEANDQ